MKATFFRFAAIAAILAAASCQKNNEQVEVSDSVSLFTASILRTRTSLDASNGKVSWVSGDSISINGTVFKTSSTGSSVLFASKAVLADSTTYEAFYPVSCSTELPAVQLYDATSSYLPLYASSGNSELVFHNICGVIGVKVKSSDIATVKKIRISSINRAMYGAFTVKGNEAVLNDSTDKTKAVVLDLGNTGVAPADTGTLFYVAVPPANYDSLKVELSSDGISYSKTMTARKTTVSVNGNTIYRWGFAVLGSYTLSQTPVITSLM